MDIRVLETVTEVDYGGTDIVLATAAGATFEATRVMVMVPLGMLKQNIISFRPALPPQERGAISGLEMGVLNKTCLLFDDVFWDEDVELIGYVSGRRGQWAETLNLYPSIDCPRRVSLGHSRSPPGEEYSRDLLPRSRRRSDVDDEPAN